MTSSSPVRAALLIALAAALSGCADLPKTLSGYRSTTPEEASRRAATARAAYADCRATRKDIPAVCTDLKEIADRDAEEAAAIAGGKKTSPLARLGL